jgi:hypothetical protein
MSLVATARQSLADFPLSWDFVNLSKTLAVLVQGRQIDRLYR